MLMLDGRIRSHDIAVLCLQNGGQGQHVRVINRETKKTYLARVTGPGLVTQHCRTEQSL